MRRGFFGPLIVGWLLGVLTAAVLPDLVFERRTVSVSQSFERRDVEDFTASGWRIVRTISAGGNAVFVELERAPWAQLAAEIREHLNWRWYMLTGRW